MGKKKIVRKPIEKLSEKEQIEVIEDSSSSEEEFDEIPPPPKLVKAKPKKERSAKQLANDQRLRDAAAAKKAAKAKPATKPEVTLDTSLHDGEPVKKTPSPPQDPDDKPLTMKQYKALLAEPKPKRKYTKREKKATAAPTPAPSPTVSPNPTIFFV